MVVIRVELALKMFYVEAKVPSFPIHPLSLTKACNELHNITGFTINQSINFRLFMTEMTEPH